MKFQIVLQNKREARALKIGIQNLQQKVFDLTRQRERETDPEKLQELDQKIAQAKLEATRLKAILKKARTPVGNPIDVTLSVS